MTSRNTRWEPRRWGEVIRSIRGPIPSCVRKLRGFVVVWEGRYYLSEGQADPVEIVLPKGGYVPRFDLRVIPEPVDTASVSRNTASTATRTGGRFLWLMVGLLVGAVCAGGICSSGL